MRRRTVVLGGFASCIVLRAPLADAQAPSGLPLVDVICTGTEVTSAWQPDALRRGMREAGHVEDKTYRMKVRYAQGEANNYPALFREAIAERPRVIVVFGLIAARAARAATTSVPVVVATGSDLVDGGVVASHSRPGGNITGVSDLTDESTAKRVELLKAALPGTTRIALLYNSEFPSAAKVVSRVEETARALGIAVTNYPMRDRASMFAALEKIAHARPDALLAAGDQVTTSFRDELIDRATALRVPVVHYWPGTAERGAILSLHTDVDENVRRAAGYVDSILKGANPAEMPIYQPTRYELAVNVKAARAFGLTIAPALLLRADKVIR